MHVGHVELRCPWWRTCMQLKYASTTAARTSTAACKPQALTSSHLLRFLVIRRGKALVLEQLPIWTKVLLQSVLHRPGCAMWQGHVRARHSAHATGHDCAPVPPDCAPVPPACREAYSARYMVGTGLPLQVWPHLHVSSPDCHWPLESNHSRAVACPKLSCHNHCMPRPLHAQPLLQQQGHGHLTLQSSGQACRSKSARSLQPSNCL